MVNVLKRDSSAIALNDNEKALFIGRFQPFHNGHLSALKQIEKDKDIKKIIIGIGSSQYENLPDNPFSFAQRKKMIKTAIKNIITVPCRIVAVPDIHDEKNWVEHTKKCVGKFDAIYTGNDWVKRLFKEKGYDVKKIKKQIKISGTELRKMIKDNDDKWKKYVPKNIAHIIMTENNIQNV
jgi:nicotinamide-nucleotide adenylyltransferase